MSRSTVSSSISTIRTYSRSVVPIRPSKSTKAGQLPRKPCKNAVGNGMQLCARTLSTRSKYELCDYCRRADNKWAKASNKDIVHWYRAHSLRAFRIAPHLPQDVTTVKKRA